MDLLMNRHIVSRKFIKYLIFFTYAVLISGCYSDNRTLKKLESVCKNQFNIKIKDKEFYNNYIYIIKEIYGKSNSNFKYLHYDTIVDGYEYEYFSSRERSIRYPLKTGEILNYKTIIIKNRKEFVIINSFVAGLSVPFSPVTANCYDVLSELGVKNPYWKSGK